MRAPGVACAARRARDRARRLGAARLDPVLVERRLERAHGGAAHAHLRVSPVIGILRGASPVIGEADAAGERHRAVDDEHLAVGAVVDASSDHARTRLNHTSRTPAASSCATDVVGQIVGAVAIEHDAHVHAAAGRGHEGLREAGADLAVGVDEALEADAPLRAFDRLQHRGEDVVAVLQHVERIAAGHRRAEQRGRRSRGNPRRERPPGSAPAACADPGRAAAATRHSRDRRDHERPLSPSATAPYPRLACNLQAGAGSSSDPRVG